MWLGGCLHWRRRARQLMCDNQSLNSPGVVCLYPSSRAQVGNPSPLGSFSVTLSTTVRGSEAQSELRLLTIPDGTPVPEFTLAEAVGGRGGGGGRGTSPPSICHSRPY